MKTDLLNNYNFLFEKELIEEIKNEGFFKAYNASEEIISPGQYIKSIPLLLEGAIKVSRKDKVGDEVFLYYLERGETCSISMKCCLGNAKSEIVARAETDAQIVLIPIAFMDSWMVKYKTWREFVLNSFQHRLNEVIHTIDSLVFMKMDERLLLYLQDKTKINHSSRLSITHMEIAQDFHTSRVVISRLLKKLEINQDVELHRNGIEVLSL